MANALAGFRVLEVAAWTFVPAAGAVMADWGADVIKVEHPVGGDPQRGLISMGLVPGGPGAVNYIIEQPNRGKRSIGLDISTDDGRFPGITRYGGSAGSSVPNASASACANRFATSRSCWSPRTWSGWAWSKPMKSIGTNVVPWCSSWKYAC